MKYLKIIGLYFSNSLQGLLSNPAAFYIFFVSKLLRFGLFIAFLYFLTSNISNIGGFTTNQIIVFYLTFNLIDTTAQMLFREVYRFRPLLVSGDFDMILSKPFPPLIRVLVGGPDFIDMGILVVLILVVSHFLVYTIKPELINVGLYLLLIINSLVIATALHVVVLAIGFLTLSIDHMVMIYRDITSLMRIPVDFFSDSLRAFLTFVIPVGIMFTFPAKVLLGLLSWQLVVVSFIVSIVLMCLSLLFWNYSIRYYQSASS